MKENRIPQKELEKIHSQVKDYPFYYSHKHTLKVVQKLMTLTFFIYSLNSYERRLTCVISFFVTTGKIKKCDRLLTQLRLKCM